MNHLEHLKTKIRDIQDFPTPGVLFRDIAPVLEDPEALHIIVDGLTDFFKGRGVEKVVGIDARGFLFSAPLAYLLDAGVVMARKKGKLPAETIRRQHGLEYGKGTLEMHRDAIVRGERIAIIDDVLATGGTASAAVDLVRELGGDIVGLGFFLELTEFDGRKHLAPHEVFSLLVY